MLHETPLCHGIAHDPETVTPFGHVYWLFDGMNHTLNRFDFEEPHGPGSSTTAASIRRFEDVELTPVPGIPSHLMMDPDQRVLYVADTGTGRVLRVDPDSGHFLRNARREFSIYSSMEPTFEYSIYGCTSQDVFASGIDRPSGLHVDGVHVYVAEYGTGRILCSIRPQVGECRGWRPVRKVCSVWRWTTASSGTQTAGERRRESGGGRSVPGGRRGQAAGPSLL